MDSQFQPSRQRPLVALWATLILLACAAPYLFVWWAPLAGAPVDSEANLCWLGRAAQPSVRLTHHPETAAGLEEGAFLPTGEVVLVEPAFGGSGVPAGWVHVSIVRPRDTDTGRWPMRADGHVRIDELRAVTVSEVLRTAPRRARIQVPLELQWPLRWGALSAAEYGTDGAPVMSLVFGGTFALYQAPADGRPRWLLARSLQDRLLMRPGVWVVPGHRADGVPPDVLVFEPPVTLVCWRWQGTSMAPAPPRLGEYLLLIWLWAWGCRWWLAVAASVTLACLACDRWLATGPWVIPAVLPSHVGLSIVLWTPYRFGVGGRVAIVVATAWALSAIALRKKTILAILVTAAAGVLLVLVGVFMEDADWLMRP